jgi:predicted ATPase/DNA-binding SARP family transcriptional activator
MLHIKLLGRFQVERDGVALTAFHSQKTQSLFAYLIIHRDRAHLRSVLADLFWGESDEARAQANLRHALYSLRRTIEGPEGRFGRYILTEGSAVRFYTDSPYRLDTEQFEQTLESAQSAPVEERPQLLQQAIALYQGDLLPGFYDDWVVIKQEHLRELYLHALKELAAQCTEQKDYSHAIEWARRALAANPLQEDLHRALMQLHLLVGNRTGALQQYSECESVLHRELNAVPLPETRALYEKLVQGKSLESISPNDLPPEMPFIGRERELEALHRLWTNALEGQGQAVFIGGEIGVGKTSFVQRFLEDLTPQPPSLGEGLGVRPYILRGAAYALGSELPYQPLLQAVRQGLQSCSSAKLAELSALARRELAQFFSEIQEQFPELKPNPPLPPAQAKARWFAALTSFFELLARERPLVLFLDDLHWADGATLEYLGHLVGAKHAMPLLVIGTYRTEEASEGSRLRTWLDKLGPGRSYRPLTLPRLSQKETHWLVERLLAGTVRELPLQLYHETEGNPLFLTEFVRALVQSGILRQDREDRWQLTIAEIGPAYWPENLRELIEASLRRAPIRAQSLLGPLAVIGQTAELPVLRELLHQSEARLLERLDELCRVGLIVKREGRYQFYHEMVRQVVYEGLNTDRKKLWHRKAGQVLEMLYQDHLDELSGELTEHFERAQMWEKAAAYAERAGMRAVKFYAYNEALKFFTKALKIFEQWQAHQPLNASLKKKKLELLTHYTDKSIFLSISDIVPMREKMQAAVAEMIALAKKLGDERQLCEAYRREYRLDLTLGRREAAQDALRRALEISYKLVRGKTPDASVAEILESTADMHSQLFQFRQAQEDYQRASNIWATLGDARRQGHTLYQIAIIRYFFGQFAQAQQSIEEAHQHFTTAGDLHGQASAFNFLGAYILREMGELTRAQACCEQAYALMKTAGDQRGIAVALSNLGTIHTDQKHYDEGLRYFEQTLLMLDTFGMKGIALEAFSEKAQAHLGRGELALALNCSMQAIRLLEEQHGIKWQAERIYFTHFQTLQANQRHEEAKAYLSKAYLELCRVTNQIQEQGLRKDFLKNVPINRQIMQAWETAQRQSQTTDKRSDEGRG